MVEIEPVYANYAINNSTGEIALPNTKRILTENLIYIPEGANLTTELSDTGTYNPFFRYCFDKNKRFLSRVTEGLADGTFYVRLVTARKDGEDISPQDVNTAFTVKLEKETSYELIEDINNEIGIEDVVITPVVGYYINASSLERPLSSFNRSNPIEITKDTIVEFTATGANTNVSMIATSDQNGTVFQSKVLSVDSTQRTYRFIADENCYIVVSYKNNEPYSLTLFYPISNKSLNERLNSTTSIVNAIEDSDVINLSKEANIKTSIEDTAITIGEAGHYVGNDGTLKTQSSFNVSTEIALKAGETIAFNANGYNSNVAILARVNSDNSYRPLIIGTDSIEREYTFLAEYDMRVVISSHKNTSPNYSIFSSKLGVIELNLNKNFVAFTSMGILGDSLASGASNYDGGGVSDRKNYSWGKYIEREYGIDVNLFTAGGATTRSWLSQPFGLTALNNANALECYIIGLGVNDAYSLGMSYLGTIDDVHVGSENNNPDTYYGNYSKIIGAIKEKSPRAKIICLTNPRATKSPQTDFNSAISDIVEMYSNTYLIDLASDVFYTSPEFKDTWYSAHSTAVGYKLVANNIYTHLNDLIRSNLSEFLDIQWIIENHS